MRRLLITLKASVAGIVSLVILAACTTADERGIRSAKVLEQRGAVDGFYIENVDTQKTNEGLRKVQNLILTVNVGSTVSTANQASYLNYFLNLAWSINDARPDGSIVLIFASTNNEEVDWRKCAQEMGLKLEPSLNSSVVALSVISAENAFGAWPGEVPSLPTSTRS